MKKLFILVICIVNLTLLSTTISIAATKNSGTINLVNYIKKDINIDGATYKLSNTVKVYGFNGNKFLNVKKLTNTMFIDYIFSTKKGISTISEIWVQAD